MITSQADATGPDRTASGYNYGHFRPEHYDFRGFDGPKPGDDAPDFEALTPEGDPVRLSDFAGRWVVLETGSITCPSTDSKVHATDELQREHPGVEFVRLYTRARPTTSSTRSTTTPTARERSSRSTASSGPCWSTTRSN